MNRISVKHVLWFLIVGSSIAGVFITKEGIYTKLSRDIAGGITLPSYSLPIAAIVLIVLIEQLRRKYPNPYVNLVLGLLWICLIGLIIGNT